MTPTVADVGDLPFDDGSFDLVVSFTGLHCFPDPRRAIGEMVRVLAPGGVITGSALFTDTGPATRRCAAPAPGRASSARCAPPVRPAPGCARPAATEVDLSLHGALGYFRAVRGGDAR